MDFHLIHLKTNQIALNFVIVFRYESPVPISMTSSFWLSSIAEILPPQSINFWIPLVNCNSFLLFFTSFNALKIDGLNLYNATIEKLDFGISGIC